MKCCFDRKLQRPAGGRIRYNIAVYNPKGNSLQKGILCSPVNPVQLKIKIKEEVLAWL